VTTTMHLVRIWATEHESSMRKLLPCLPEVCLQKPGLVHPQKVVVLCRSLH